MKTKLEIRLLYILVATIAIGSMLGNSLAFANESRYQTNEEFREWQSNGYQDVAVTTIDLSATTDLPATKVKLPVNVLLLKNTGWSKEDTLAQLKRVNEIFAACNITLSKVTLVEAVAPNGWLDVADGWANGPKELASSPDLVASTSFSEDALTLFLIRTTGNYFYEAWTGQSMGTENKVFVSANVLSEKYKEHRQKGYSPIAHEFLHALCPECRHTDFPNLLAGKRELVNSNITGEQCEVMRQSRFTQRSLKLTELANQ